MFSVSVAFLQLLANATRQFDFSWKLEAVNEIVRAAEAERGVHTIAYFGPPIDIEPFITASAGTPKVVNALELGADVTSFKTALFNGNIFFISLVSNGDLSRILRYQMQEAFKGLQGRAHGVFVMPPERRTPSAVLEHFSWCWKAGFLNALVLVEQHRNGLPTYAVFGYRRFPALEAQSFELGENAAYFTANKLAWLHGERLRSPAQFDPPRVFAFYEHRTHTTKLKGYAAEMFQQFLQTHGAQLQIVDSGNSSRYDIRAIIERLNRGDFDFSMNPYIAFNDLHISYPIKMMQWCIMVPSSGELEQFLYFVRPFQPGTWRYCLVAMLYISVMTWSMDCLSASSAADLGGACLEVLRFMCCLPVPSTHLRQRFVLYQMGSFVLKASLGFVLTNLYVALLTSFLAALMFHHPIETLEEMVQRNLSVHAIDFEVPIILSNNRLPRGFDKLLVGRDATALMQDIITLKPGRAYTAREDLLNFALSQQSHLRRPLFHVARECISTVPIGLLMPSYSPYEAILNRFIFSAAQCGLTEKWFKSTVADGFAAGLLRARKSSQPPTRPLSLEHFQFAFIVLGAGTASALLCFALENVHRLSRRVAFFVVYF